MKKIILVLFAVALYMQAHACTTFFINAKGQLVFGRNYDWITGNGMVCTNLKGLSKTSSKTNDGEAITWVSKYGSITFNQYGKEFPTGGMNETGLVVELMWLDGSQYPKADSRPAVDVLQWVQYQLDNSKTTEDVIASDKKIRIASQGNAPLHYLIADANGKAAVIEFLDGAMVVHAGDDLPFPVLTNSTYASSLASVKGSNVATAASTASAEITFKDNSLDRFTTACSMVKEYQQGNNEMPVIDYSFNILESVSQGDHTKWSIVYDIKNKKVHFKTKDYQDVKIVSFSKFEFSCPSIPAAWDMNQEGAGDVSKLFIPFSIELNQQIVEKSFDESSSEIKVSKEGREETWKYAGGIGCRQ